MTTVGQWGRGVEALCGALRELMGFHPIVVCSQVLSTSQSFPVVLDRIGIVAVRSDGRRAAWTCKFGASSGRVPPAPPSRSTAPSSGPPRPALPWPTLSCRSHPHYLLDDRQQGGAGNGTAGYWTEAMMVCSGDGLEGAGRAAG